MSRSVGDLLIAVAVGVALLLVLFAFPGWVAYLVIAWLGPVTFWEKAASIFVSVIVYAAVWSVLFVLFVKLFEGPN